MRTQHMAGFVYSSEAGAAALLKVVVSCLTVGADVPMLSNTAFPVTAPPLAHRNTLVWFGASESKVLTSRMSVLLKKVQRSWTSAYCSAVLTCTTHGVTVASLKPGVL